jgi:hypothetical protein
MRALWTLHRRLVLVVALCVVLVASAAVVVLALRSDLGPAATRPPAAVRARSAPVSTTTSPSRRRAAPAATIEPSESAIQQQIDTALARAENPASIAAAEATSVPAPAVSAAYPPVRAADRFDPTAYAIAFATELLDTSYATQTRAQLLAWAEHEEARDTLPGIPADVAGKSLVLSLADPGLPGATPSPVPSSARWAKEAGARVTQMVSDVAAEVDPDWTEIVSEGWEPADPRMTIETVTGNLTVATSGRAAAPEPFTLTLTLGTAAHAPGYGAVAAADWTLG